MSGRNTVIGGHLYEVWEVYEDPRMSWVRFYEVWELYGDLREATYLFIQHEFSVKFKEKAQGDLIYDVRFFFVSISKWSILSQKL